MKVWKAGHTVCLLSIMREDGLPGPREVGCPDPALGDAELFISGFCYNGLVSFGDLWEDVAWQNIEHASGCRGRPADHASLLVRARHALQVQAWRWDSRPQQCVAVGVRGGWEGDRLASKERLCGLTANCSRLRTSRRPWLGGFRTVDKTFTIV